MTDKVDQAKDLVERRLGYVFHNNKHLLEALDTTGMRVSQSNQRLALLGDAILKHVILDAWYPTGDAKGTGNKLVSTIGSNASLDRAGRRVGIDACVITHPGHNGPVSQGTVSTTMEAVLGAIYLDSGKDMGTVKTVMTAMGLMPFASE